MSLVWAALMFMHATSETPVAAELRSLAPLPMLTNSLQVSPRVPASGTGASAAQRSVERQAFVRTRLIFLPTFIFSRFLRSFSNALCRPEPGPLARRRGVNRSDVCNGSIDGGMRWRKDRFWLEFGGLYARLAMPQSNWVAQGEDISAADLTEISLHVIGVQLGLLREFSLGQRLKRWRWQLGAQLGFGLLRGHVYRTKLGAQNASCTFAKLGDLSVCRPFRAVEFNEPERNPPFFAKCTKKNCDDHDLQRAGRGTEALPGFVPWIGLTTGPQVWLHPRLALKAEFGIGLGFFVGLGIDWRLPAPVFRQTRIEK